MSGEQVIAQWQVRAWRWHTHQLDREPDSVADVAQVAVLDLGVQETGPIGALWSLACRGLTAPEEPERELFWAWTLRGAPHAYRRRDLAKVAAATTPYDERDAAARIFDAATPLRRCGIQVLDELCRIARKERDLVREPMLKGGLSAALTDQLEPHSVRWCVPCQATHPWELPFRLAALQAGLEIEPGSSPPVLRRAPRTRPQLYAARRRERRLDPVSAFLHLLGPASVREVAGYLDGAAASVEERMPEGSVRVRVEGLPGVRHLLARDAETLPAVEDSSAGVLRLLGPYDPICSYATASCWCRTRPSDSSSGRPSAGPEQSSSTGRWSGYGEPGRAGAGSPCGPACWDTIPRAARAALEAEAERLAAHRGQLLAGVVDDLA